MVRTALCLWLLPLSYDIHLCTFIYERWTPPSTICWNIPDYYIASVMKLQWMCRIVVSLSTFFLTIIYILILRIFFLIQNFRLARFRDLNRLTLSPSQDSRRFFDNYIVIHYYYSLSPLFIYHRTVTVSHVVIIARIFFSWFFSPSSHTVPSLPSPSYARAL